VFGEKDWQQLQVIARMTADLSLPVRVVGAAVVREADGLAMSSRNRFLTHAEREVAPLLHEVLRDVRDAMRSGEPPGDALATGARRLTARSFVPEYLALVDNATLAQTDRPGENARLIAAARLGSVRLLDNIAADIGPAGA
jgi:pantoate--beta-alanine ligase